MIKLYPPVIEGTIPAFYGTTLVVPFSMNRAVSKTDISGFALKIKTVQSNTFVKNLTTQDYTLYEASFEIPEDLLVAGQYYKLQLAYINTHGEIGYYSTVGVIKYYGEVGPKIYVDGLSAKKSNIFTGNYIGVFRHEDEPMEKVSQYRFIISDSDGNIVDDTDWTVHNTINDINSLVSNDTYKYNDELDLNTSYFLQYKVITSNNMLCSSPKYKILQKNSVGAILNVNLKAENNFENGYILIQIGGNGEDVLLTGSFEISRRDILNPRHWDPIFVFALQGERPMVSAWKDFTVEQGITYEYCIRQFNEAGVYSDRIISNQVYADFENAFLFDGQRQLKIKYNPKVSSFKNDILESKTDTIGSKYPFIFRNGHVNYKEFPISGLISYWSDDENLFMSYEDIDISDGEKLERREDLPWNLKTTDLVNYNIAAERKFKLEALEWLTNGKPKLFRSPGEGNYIVRLLNTTMSPTDALGRMLHTFNSTAYEVSEINYSTLTGYDFIKTDLVESETQQTYYRSVELKDIIEGNNPEYPIDEEGYVELLRNPYNKNEILRALTIRFEDMSSTDIVYINGERRMIGGTGVYNLDNGDEIYSVKVRSVANFNEDEYAIDYDIYEKAVADLKARQDAKQAEIDAQNEILENQQMLINNFIDSEIDVADNAQIKEYNNLIQEQDNIIAQKAEDLENAQTDYDELSADIHNINTDIAAQESLKEIVEEKLATANNQGMIDGKVSALQAQQAALNAEITNLQTEINEESLALNTDKAVYNENKETIDAIIDTFDERRLFVSQLEEMLVKDEWAQSMKTRLAALDISWDYVHAFSNKYGHYLKEYNPTTKKAKDGAVTPNWSSGVIKSAIDSLNKTKTKKNKSLTTLKKEMTDQGRPATRKDCQDKIKEHADLIAQYEQDIKTKQQEYADAQTEEKKATIQEAIQKIINNKRAEEAKKTILENLLEDSAASAKYDEIDTLIKEIEAIDKKIARINELHDEMKEKIAWPKDTSSILKTLSWKYFYEDGSDDFKKVEKKVNINEKPSTLTINAETLQAAINLQNGKIEANMKYANIDAREVLIAAKQTELTKKQADLTRIRDELQEYDALIMDREYTIQTWQAELTTINNQLSALNSSLNSKLEDLELLAAEIAEIRQDIQDAENQKDTIKIEKKRYIVEVLKKEKIQELEDQKEEIKRVIKELNYELMLLQEETIEEPNKANYINGNTWDNNILNDYEGVFTYSYIDKYSNSFDLITSQTLIDVPCQQFNSSDSGKNVLKNFFNNKVELINILQIQAELKQVENIYLFRDPNSLILTSDREIAKMDEGVLIEPKVIKDNFSLDKAKVLGEEELSLIENPLYMYHIYPVLSHSLNVYGNHGGILFGFVRDENDIDKGEYIQLLHIAENEEQAEWHAPDIAYVEYKEDEYFKIQFFSREEFEDFAQDYTLYRYNTSTQLYEETSEYVYTEQYYTKDYRFAHVTFHRGEQYYADISYYEITQGDDGNYYLNTFNPYYNFNDDQFNGYFLIYNDEEQKFQITKGYSNKIYINTGFDEDLEARVDGELYTPSGEKVKPYLDLTLTQEFTTELIPQVTDIHIGNGVILNLSYQAREIGYNLEEKVVSLKQAKKEWQDAKTAFNKFFFTQIDIDEYKFHNENWTCIDNDDDNAFDEIMGRLKQAKQTLNEKYEAYLVELKAALDSYEAQRSWEKYQEVEDNG